MCKTCIEKIREEYRADVPAAPAGIATARGVCLHSVADPKCDNDYCLGTAPLQRPAQTIPVDRGDQALPVSGLIGAFGLPLQVLDGGSVPALPIDPAARKAVPITTGVFDYFPLALAEIARVSKAGNDQHNPGQPLHWARGKSTDHADCIGRHLLDRGTRDSDGQRHSAKLAWRALALLQTELEDERRGEADT